MRPSVVVFRNHQRWGAWDPGAVVIARPRDFYNVRLNFSDGVDLVPFIVQTREDHLSPPQKTPAWGRAPGPQGAGDDDFSEEGFSRHPPSGLGVGGTTRPPGRWGGWVVAGASGYCSIRAPKKTLHLPYFYLGL